MRPALLALLTGLTGLALVPVPAGPGAASCAGPQVEVPGAPVVRGRPVLERGSEVTVRGRYFVDGCDDTGTARSTVGCSGDDGGETVGPLQDVELRLGSTPVASADAEGDLGTVAWTFTVPDSLRPGLVRLRTVDSPVGQWVRIR